MTILCATDFSSESDVACDVAAQLAAKSNEQLVLLHVRSAEADAGADAKLRTASERLKRLHGNVVARMENGAIDATVASIAEGVKARLIVLGASAGDRPKVG